MAIHLQDGSSPSSTSTVLSTKNDDCYFYYYSSCTKGNQCPFRHEPAALRNETMCRFWLQGHCSKPNCIFRHMEINQPRNKVPCFFESQPGGCKKVHCAFLHSNVLDQPREEDRSKNPDIILPLAGSQSPPSDDDHSCSSLSQVARSRLTPVQQFSSLGSSYHRRTSAAIVLSRSPSRSPEFAQLPPHHPPVIVTVSDLESEGECADSPQKSWMPKPVYTEVVQDPVRTKAREEELNKLRKIQEEQAEVIGYIFERGDEEEEMVALANGEHSNLLVPSFVDEIEEFDVEDEELENFMPATCSSTSEFSSQSNSTKANTVLRIATVIGNRVDNNIIRPTPVKAQPAPSSHTNHHHHKRTATSTPVPHHQHHMETISSHHHHRHRSSPTVERFSSPALSTWSPSDSSRHQTNQSSSGDCLSSTETSDVLRLGGSSRRLRRGGLAGNLIADALGTSNSPSKFHGNSKRLREDRDQSVQSMDYRDYRLSRNGSSHSHHRDGSFKAVHNRSNDRNEVYPGSARRESPTESQYSSRKRSLPRDGTPERDTKRRLGSDFHRRSEHHLNNLSNGIDKSSSLKSGVSSSVGRQGREAPDDRLNRKISLHERFTTSGNTDNPAEIPINSSANDWRSVRSSSHTTREKEHSRNREDSFSRSVRTRIEFPNSSSSHDRSRSKSPEKISRPVASPVGEIKIKSLSEIRQEKAKKFAALSKDSSKTEHSKPSGVKRKRSSISFEDSEAKINNSCIISIKRSRLDPEAAPFVPSSSHHRFVDVTELVSSRVTHDSINRNNDKVSVDCKSKRSVDSLKPSRIVENIACSSLNFSTLSEKAASITVGQSDALCKDLDEEEEELLLTQYDEVDYEIDDIDESDLFL